MKQIKTLSLFATLLMGALAMGGCGSSSSSTAAFKVQLKNSTAALTMSLDRMLSSPGILATATSVKLKLGGVDILGDCTNGQPPGNCLDLGRSPDPDIWVNKGCNDDIAQCTNANTEFFELIDPTAANTELSSQGRSIEAGTFTHVRIYFLNNDSGDAVQCNGANNADRPAVPVQYQLPSSLTVATGESVTVTLNYDPSGIDCANAATISSAIAAMTATATKN